jgi:hypothetical protein
MCHITETSHVYLEVPPGEQREIARALLAGAEAAGVDPANPCHVTTTTEGFRVSAEVLAKTDLETSTPPADEAPADEAPADEVPADEVPADEVPAAEVPADEVPADEVPADEAPAATAPASAKRRTRAKDK